MKYFECDFAPRGCDTIVAAWTKGDEKFSTPPETGFKVGRATDIIHVVLQVHYSNTVSSVNVVDSSGLKLELTQKIRPYDAGLLIVGAWLPYLSIPPNQEAYGLRQYCDPGRLSSFLGDLDHVNVFANGLFAHKLGRSVWTELIRNNSLQGILGANMHYEYNEQSFMRYTNSTIKVLQRGDAIRNSCIWNTSSVSTSTVGGTKFEEQERCYNFLMYYPKSQSVINNAALAWCISPTGDFRFSIILLSMEFQHFNIFLNPIKFSLLIY